MHPTDPAHEAKRDAFDHAVETLAHHQAQNGANEILNLTEAAKLAGVSRGRLYRAIETGRLDAMPGGGPGKPTMVTREALRRAGFPVSEASEVRVERSMERSDMEPRAEMERLMERFMEQAVERFIERLTERLPAILAPVIERSIERHERSENVPPIPPTLSPPTPRTSHAAMLPRLLAWRQGGVSGREMARRLNAEGVPTVTGRGQWTDGQISRMLRAHDGERSAEGG